MNQQQSAWRLGLFGAVLGILLLGMVAPARHLFAPAPAPQPDMRSGFITSEVAAPAEPVYVAREPHWRQCSNCQGLGTQGHFLRSGAYLTIPCRACGGAGGFWTAY